MNFSELVAPNGLFSDGDWIEKKDQDENGTVRLIQLADIGACFFKDKSAKFVTEAKAKELNCTYLQKGDILIARLPDPLGRACIFPLDGKYITAVDVAIVRISRSDINPKYVMYMINSPGFRNDIKHYESGTTRKRISRKNLDKIQFNIPPLPEQEHIISRIEELFSQLDASVAELKTAKERLKVYRQAVLKEAFEGRYSRAWRKNHPEYSPQNDLDSIKFTEPIFKDTSGDENEICLSLPETWVKVRLGEIFEVEVGATPSRQKTEYWNGEIPWVSSGEVHFDTISQTNEFITQEGLKHASTNIQPVGTVMLAMIGEGKTRGQAALLHVEAAHNQNTAAILVSKTSCEPKYVYYFLMLNYENTRRVGSGNNQKALNKERVRALRFPFTSFEEQSLIVQEIESRLSVCDSIQKTVDTALRQAEALRQSILKKAFEGKLI